MSEHVGSSRLDSGKEDDMSDEREAKMTGIILAQQLVLSGILAALVRAQVLKRDEAEEIIRVETFSNEMVAAAQLVEGALPSNVEAMRNNCLATLNEMQL